MPDWMISGGRESFSAKQLICIHFLKDMYQPRPRRKRLPTLSFAAVTAEASRAV